LDEDKEKMLIKYTMKEGLQVFTRKNLKDPEIKGKYFHLNEDQDNADAQKADQLAS